MKTSVSVLSGFLILGLFGPLVGQEKTLQGSQDAFARVDRTLNEVYQEAKAKLPEWRFEKIREEQRSWIEYRDARALSAAQFDGGADEGAEKQNPEFWNALAYLTDTRIEILNGWLRIDEFSSDWEGVWIDGYGGLLSIAEANDGELQFALQVVRGPTYHSGAIAGQAIANTTTARFATTAEGGEEETWLTFLSEEGQLRVIGENTNYFHGARAYFDGKYIRIRELTEEDRKSIESPDF